MRYKLSLPMIVVLVLCWSSCSLDDDDRCGEGFIWENNTCYPVQEQDTTPVPDGGTDTDTDLPSGMGKVCTEAGGECANEEADYCVLQPGNLEGYCSLQDCIADPNNCPGTYICCDFSIDGIPNFCASKEDFELMTSMCNQ